MRCLASGRSERVPGTASHAMQGTALEPEIGMSGSMSGEKNRGWAGGPVKQLPMVNTVGTTQDSACFIAKSDSARLHIRSAMRF